MGSREVSITIISNIYNRDVLRGSGLGIKIRRCGGEEDFTEVSFCQLHVMVFHELDNI